MNDTGLKNKPIIFIDSGIGGLPYCRGFIKANPNETVYYIADNKNYPYGGRGKNELTLMLTALTEKAIKKLDPKIIVFACNTATIASINEIREKFTGLQFVGTVPAIKPAAAFSNYEKVGVLGTERTIEEIKKLNLAEKPCKVFGVAAPELVDFIEKQSDNCSENEKIEVVKKYINIFKDADVRALVLGCTHFLFLLNEFRREAAPYCIEVFDSLEGITKRIEFLLDESNGALRTANNNAIDSATLVITKNEAIPVWQKRAEKAGFKLTLLDNL